MSVSSLDAVRRDELESLEIDLLLTAMSKCYGYDFREYARASLVRRLRQALSNENLPNFSALQERVLHDPSCMSRVVQCLSVHVSSMFRDPVFYRALRHKAVPILRTYPFVRVWVTGCATGEEVYSVAIVLKEEGIYDRCRIYATDVSDPLVARAQRGVFPLRVMRGYTADYLRSGGADDFSSYYTTDHENAVLRSELRSNVVFSQHNLVTDGSFNEFNLILCRNVMIYFNRTLRDRIHDLLYSSLNRFGLLGLGRKESVDFTSVSAQYEELDHDSRLYRRVA